MFFYMDESGNSGPNLLDPQQKIFYYGILSSRSDLNQTARALVCEMRSITNTKNRLHANRLGWDNIILIKEQIESLFSDHNIGFNVVSINKEDNAIMSFFDTVLDPLFNNRFPKVFYHSKARFVFLRDFCCLFDNPLAGMAWESITDEDPHHVKFKGVITVLL